MTNIAFYNASIALAAGVLGQIAAQRMRIPSIVLLLGIGALLGPDVLGWLDPEALRGGRSDIVAFAVAVILFEGGLALDLSRLRQQRRTLILLLTVGGAMSMLAGTLAAHLLLGMAWSIAILYGALMIVTGPTVVTPLLSRMTVERRPRELLISEGVLIDPLGAIVALVAAEAVIGWHGPIASGRVVLFRLALGGTAGVIAGLVLARVLRRRAIPDELRSITALAAAVLVAAASSRISPEAGLMSAVAQGVTLANSGVRDLGKLREFKEQLTIILLSFVFVLLAADVRLGAVEELGLPALGVVAVLIWVARPLSVLIATLGSETTWRERAFIAWICPRGIVAAAVAGLFRSLLDGANTPGGRELEALVFLTVALTVTVQGMTAERVAHLLHLDFPAVRGVVVIGANRLGRILARTLRDLGQQVVLLDRSPSLCRVAREEGFTVYEGDALSVDVLEEAGTRYADTVVTLTSNYELNALILNRVRENFAVERLTGLVESGPDEPGDVRRGIFPGDFPGLEEANRAARLGTLTMVAYDIGEALAGRRLDSLPYAPGEFAAVVQRSEAVTLAAPDHVTAAGERLWCAKPAGVVSPLAGAEAAEGALAGALPG